MPSGLIFDSDSRVISGTPNALQATRVYTYTVTDADGDYDTLSFTIAVSESEVRDSQPIPPTETQSFLYVAGQSVYPSRWERKLLPFTGGDGELTYSLSATPRLPAGFAFYPTTRTFRGGHDFWQIDDSAPATTYTYYATDEDGDTASATFTIEVLDFVPVAPPWEEEKVYTFNQYEPITPIVFPSFTVTPDNPYPDEITRTLTYSYTRLPSGLTMNRDLRTLSGTPYVPGTYPMRFIASAGSDRAEIRFTIIVVEPIPKPPAISQDLSIQVGVTERLSLRPFTDGNGELTYSLSSTPNLPTGLSFNPTSLEISGQISDTAGDDSVPIATYTYSARDEDGDEASTTFTLEVLDPRPVAPIVNDLEFTANEAVESIVLPEFTTTTITNEKNLTYSLSGLSSGLVFDANTRTISGAPDIAGEFAVTYSASDGVDFSSVAFTISVFDDPIPMPPTIPSGGYAFEPGEEVNVTLPPFTVSDGSTLTHSLDDADDRVPITTLIGGLIYDPQTRTISGTVPGTAGDDSDSAAYIYSATDTDAVYPDTTSITFTISILDEMPAFADGASIDNISGTVSTAIIPVTLPAVFTTGTVATTYSFTPNLPQWLSFDSDTRVLSGTPTEAGAITVTYTATDADGDTANIEFTITVEEDLQLVAPKVSNFEFTLGEEISVTLPEFTGGNGVLTYSLTGLPQGLSFYPGARILSGTLFVVMPTTTITYTATDDYGTPDVFDDHEVSVTFTITVVEGQVPQEDAIPVAPTLLSNFVFTPGEDVDVTLPPFTGGDGALTHSLDDADDRVPITTLIGGLIYDPQTRTITGTVPGTAGDDSDSAAYIYSATDSDAIDPDTTRVTFTITILDADPHFGPVDILNITGTVGTAIIPGTITLPEVYPASTGPTTYSLTPQLPLGLEFDNNPSSSTYRQLSGTPISLMPTTTYTYTATDVDGDTDSLTFTITVVEGQVPQEDAIPVAPTLLSNFVFTPGEDVDVTLPPFTGGDGALTHSLDDADDRVPITTLIGGLIYDPQTRTITGTVPGTAGDDSDSAAYIYSATDSDAIDPDTTRVTFTITILDADPHFGPVDILNITGTVGTAIIPGTITLPEVYPASTGPTTYSLTPQLPLGLEFDNNPSSSTYRQLSGTPISLMPTTTYTYTATDVDGDTDSLTFTITVVEGQVPQEDAIPVAPTLLSNFVFTPGEDVDVTLPPFTGGDGALTHSLDDADDRVPITTLIGGLIYDPQTRTITGTVPGTAGNDSDSAAYIYSATDTDEDGLHDTTNVTFTISIVDEMPAFAVGATFAAVNVTQDTAITPVTLPAVSTTGTGTTTYSLTPVPFGLSFDSDTRVLSGTPSEAGTITVTYTATDADGDTDFLAFIITVEALVLREDTKPVAPSISQDFVFVPRQSVSAWLLPFTGGDGVLTYALSPYLPAGLVFDASALTISGAVVGTSNDDSTVATTYTYSATDADGDDATATFTITIVDSLPQVPSALQNFVFAAGDMVNAVLPPFTISNGGVLTYELSPTPSLPSGLTFDANTRVISGTLVNTTGDDSFPATTYTYSATDDDGDEATATFTIEVVDFRLTAPPVPNYTFDQDVPLDPITLPSFTSTSGQPLSHTLAPLPSGLTFDKDTRELVGTPTQAGTTAVTYTASDENGEQASVVFTISVIEFYFTAPAIGGYKFTLNKLLDPITLPSFSSTSGQTLTYTLEPLPRGLTFNEVTRVLAGTPTEAGNTRVRYTATDPNGSYAATEFPIVVVDVVALETATTGALPSVGANVALVATEAISTRVGLALDGQSQGLDIRTPSGQQFKLGVNGANAQSSSTASAIRFGAWYSTSHDELSNTQTDLSWSGITDSTNVGIDIGFDLSSKASLVFGVMQNASTTSASYTNGDGTGAGLLGTGAGLLDVDLDATTFYVGFGYDWLDVWFANGSANSMLTDSASAEVIPTAFAYQTVGLTAAFDFSDGFQVGAKVESLTSALSLSSREALDYAGLESDSSQFRTAFFVNYKLDLGREGNAQFIPKFEMGYRGLTQNSNSSAAAASAGTAAETSFGVDYLQKQLNLTIGFSIRSFEVQNYASESTQWHIRWESSTYDKGLSLQLRPTVVDESLGLDALYNSDYSQYQNLLSRQYGGDTQVDDDGLDFEMGYGITLGTGTYTPFVKTTNFVFGQAANNSRRTQEVGIRYTTPSGLDLTLAMERLYSPVSSFSSQSAFGATPVLMQRENSLEFSTRYSF